jgi:hypothetical protein
VNRLSAIDEAEAEDWLARPDGVSLTIQTLHQQDGYSTTLVRVFSTHDEDDGELESLPESASKRT